MTVLVLNSGSSSLKFGIFTTGGEAILRGAVRQFGADARTEWTRPDGRTANARFPAADAGEAAAGAIERLRAEPGALDEVSAVAHRIVHGGDRFSSPVLLDLDVIAALDALSPLAPLHNPPALAAIRASRSAFGDEMPIVGVFDTGFFSGLPEHARTYALPAAWNRKPGARRLGFHGIAHRDMAERCRAARVITLQLGQGCSVAAIRDGQPLDTSMGATPLEGLVMATRCGDVDAGLLLRVMEEERLTPAAASDALNRNAGLLGLSGVTGNMRELLAMESTHAGAALAVRAFCHRARKYLGAYLALLGGADAIVFGGGIGENAPAIRARICEDMHWCGLSLDPDANEKAVGQSARISSAGSRIEVHVVAVDEESLIARDAVALLRRR
jgi:acetate kinase